MNSNIWDEEVIHIEEQAITHVGHVCLGQACFWRTDIQARKDMRYRMLPSITNIPLPFCLPTAGGHRAPF